MDVQTIAILVSILIATYIVYNNEKLAKKRATIDLVLHQKNDTDLSSALDLLRALDMDIGLAEYASMENKESSEYKAILVVLNHYEFVATGIKEKAFDENVYKRMVYGILVRDWVALKGFVAEIRQSRNRNTLFQEFQWLAERWIKKPLKENK